MPQAVAIPIATAVIGAAGSLYSANKAKQGQQPYISAMTNAANTQNATAQQLAPFSSAFYQRAMDTYDPAAAYYKAAAAGGPQLLTAAAGKLGRVDQSYNSIVSAANELNPRSGGRNMVDLAFRAGDQKQGIINDEQTNAISSLMGLSNVAGNLGAGAAGAARGSAQVGIQGNELGLGASRQLAGDQSTAYGDAAKGLFGAWKDYQANGGNGKHDAKVLGSPTPSWINAGMLAPGG